MKTIGIDIGTTTICGVVLDLDNGEILYKETISNDSFIESDLQRIQDVDIIINKALTLLNKCLDKHHDVVSIGLTGQMHGIVYIDKEGKAISPLYTWQDQRGQYVLENGLSMVEEINQCTLHPVASGYGLVTHAYFKRCQSVPENAVTVCTIMDYLGMILTSRKTPLMHITNSASLGFWDIEKGCFETDVLKKFGIEETFLPKVTHDIVSLGTYNDICVLVALGDNQASFLSTVGNNTDAVLVNMGTGGQVSMLVDKYVNIEGIETRPFIENKYLLVGASLCGGRAYAILENFFRKYVFAATGKDISQYETMEALASSVTGTSLNVCTTLKGTRTHPTQLGSIENMSEDNFLPEMLIYGFMQGMIDELYEMYIKMLKAKTVKISTLMASGNAIRKNKVLRKICEDTFLLPSRLTKYEEEAACGAAMSYFYINKEN